MLEESKSNLTTFIDPFIDFSWKRLFSTEESKPILIGLLNHLFKGRKFITAIDYGKNEFPGENVDEGGAIFDVYCTDADGSRFIIEIQRGYQKHFKDRALFYSSRAISEQAPRGGRKDWAYNLTEVYLIAFLEDFQLPDSPKHEYLQDICLANRRTGRIFHEKLGFIFIKMINFVKEPQELDAELDKWLYALKHLKEFTSRPSYLSGPEFDQLFNLASYASLTKSERIMYNASLKYKWDNKNVRDYEIGQGREQGREEGRAEVHIKALAEKREMAIKLKIKGMPAEEIAELTNFSLEEIEALT